MFSYVTKVETFERVDGLFDFRIVAVENGNTLCSSNQGYAHEAEAQRIGQRVTFASARGTVTFGKEDDE